MTQQSQALEALLSCPCCGDHLLHIESEAKSFDPPRIYHEWHHPPRADCWLRNRLGPIILIERDSDVPDAIAAWNRRALGGTPAKQGEVSEFCDVLDSCLETFWCLTKEGTDDRLLAEGAQAAVKGLRAALSQHPVAATVKPLVWEQPDGDVATDKSSWLGRGTDLCQYYIGFQGGSWWAPFDGEDGEEYPTADAAKAACQIEYEKRIRSALYASPVPAKADGGVTEELTAKDVLRNLISQFESFDQAPDDAAVWMGGWCNPEAATRVKTVRAGDIRLALQQDQRS